MWNTEKEVADKLASIYADFIDSVDKEMNEILGEIYREKLKDIFKILEDNGVPIDDMAHKKGYIK